MFKGNFEGKYKKGFGLKGRKKVVFRLCQDDLIEIRKGI